MGPSSQTVILFSICLLLCIGRVHAFGAGNIGSTSSIEGENWRHGDIEDTLLTILLSRAAGGKKFSKLDVKRVYFGNWLRDYSQAVDVGTVKYVSAEAIRILLWVLGFMSFGYGSKEFEVTTARLGCYRPEEHIDNPKDYADNQDARQYDRRLRGPVDEHKELGINPDTGMKNYIGSENLGITTSAALIRKVFTRSIQLGRQYAKSQNKADHYEALRLLGTGCHCLEDFSAHSNYVELALIELGERNIFPHVGRRTSIQLREVRHLVYPIVTGTFGGVDFLHSVMGELDDKTTQSEIQELENTMQNSQNSNENFRILQDLLNKVPSGIFGGEDQAGKADELQANATAHRMQNTFISPRQPEEWTQYLDDVQKQIAPIIEWHDQILQSITETIDAIPLLPALIEGIQDQINIFVFSLLAPFVVPIIDQVKNELNTGSSEIIKSSVEKQHIVFNDDTSSDPTHSMLSKDHFSNVLNEPAGKVASQIIKWVVPQLIACWDDDRIDVEQTLSRIIHGVLHHPALREVGQGNPRAIEGRKLMFGVIERWWREKNEDEREVLRDQLSREGVGSGRNHKPGVVDHGHGCGKPLGLVDVNNPSRVQGYGCSSNEIGDTLGEAIGGGTLGAIVGDIAGGIGGTFIGNDYGDDQKQTFNQLGYSNGDSFNQVVTQVGCNENVHRYGEVQHSRVEGPDDKFQEGYPHSEQYDAGGRQGYQTQGHNAHRSGHSRKDESDDYSRGHGPSQFQPRINDSSEFPTRRQEYQQYSEHEPRGQADQEYPPYQTQGNEYSSGPRFERHDEPEDHTGGCGRPEESRFGREQVRQSEYRHEDVYGGAHPSSPDFESSRYEQQSGAYVNPQAYAANERCRPERYGDTEEGRGIEGYSPGYREREVRDDCGENEGEYGDLERPDQDMTRRW